MDESIVLYIGSFEGAGPGVESVGKTADEAEDLIRDDHRNTWDQDPCIREPGESREDYAAAPVVRTARVEFDSLDDAVFWLHALHVDFYPASVELVKRRVLEGAS